MENSGDRDDPSSGFPIVPESATQPPSLPRNSSASVDIAPSSDTQSMSSGRRGRNPPSTQPPRGARHHQRRRHRRPGQPLTAHRSSQSGSQSDNNTRSFNHRHHHNNTTGTQTTSNYYPQDVLSVTDRREFNDLMKKGRFSLDEYEPVIERGKKKSKYVMYPDNRYRAMWDVFILNMVIYVAFISIFVISFLPQIDASNPLFWIERLLDVVFLVDIIINFFTAYEDDVYVTDLNLIAKRYVSTWFFVDLMATVPWGIIALRATHTKERALLSLPRLFRLLRLFKLFRIMRIIRLKEVFTWFEIRLRLKYGHVQLVGLAFLISLAGHWVACLFYFFGILNENAEEPLSWIKEAPDYLYGQYIYSLYFSVYTITTIGYGDVVPRTVLERTYVTVIMVVGAIVFAYSISKMSEVVNALGAASKNEHEMMDLLTSFAARRKLPAELEFEIRRFLKYHYSIQHVADEREVLEILSDRLTLQVLRHMFGELFVKCAIFKDVCGGGCTDNNSIDEKGVDCNERLDTLYPHVNEISNLDKDHVIYHVGDVVDGMYIVQRGTVVLISPNGHMIRKRKGEAFGEANLALAGRRRATAKCAGYTQLLFAPREAVMGVLECHPEALKKARQRDAEVLWNDALVLLERRAHLDDVATGLGEKVAEHLKEQGRLPDAEGETGGVGAAGESDGDGGFGGGGLGVEGAGSAGGGPGTASGFAAAKDEEKPPVLGSVIVIPGVGNSGTGASAGAGATSSTSGGARGGRGRGGQETSVEELRRALEEKDDRIRMLEGRLSSLRNELDGIMNALRQ